jgi:hypothetical protein
MKTTARSLLSALGLGLAAFTALSFLVAGFAASTTVTGIALLTVYGIFEIALIDYAPIPTRTRAPRSGSPARIGSAAASVARFPRSAPALRRAA